VFANSLTNSLCDNFSFVIKRNRCPHLPNIAFGYIQKQIQSSSAWWKFSIYLFLLFRLLKNNLLGQNALAVQKKVHKNKLMIELSIQMSSFPSYLQAQDSTVMLGYTLSTTFLFSSKNKMLREDIFSGTQQGSGIPGTTPTALTMLWMVAWFDGFKD
jgi:hypothetical protein